MVLLHGGVIYAPAHPFSTAMLIDGDTIAWIGEDTAADVHREAADDVIDLAGAFVAPGFVDAHVHATSTGLAADGLDLTGAGSADALLAAIGYFAREHPDAIVLGHGWDETTWQDPHPPSRAHIDAAADGRAVYLSRIDVHSALVSSSIASACPGVDELPGWSPDGPISRQAHHRVRDHALASVSPAQREGAHRALRRLAAQHGIVAVHEMAGPSISSVEDLDALLSLADAEPGPLVAGYWGQLAERGGIDIARELGAAGVAGDLFIDGAIGSRTACLHEPYTDDPSSTGTCFVDVEQVFDHVVAATEAGMQAGFHVIGDAACAIVTAGLRRAADHLGSAAIRAAGHRLEHAEMLSDDDISALVEYGVTASMQPMFDALWADPGGMYEQRLGRSRADSMNRFADIVAAGGMLAFSSDAPVTEIGPWAAVRAAMHHSSPAQSISARAAFSAHTRGGWRAVGETGAGILAPGAPAHLAVWRAQEFDVQAPDARVSGWSTDPRSGTPALPVLSPEDALPECLVTVVAGTVVHTTGECDWS
jgi:predicted amidohydrolase YtcJ